MASLYANENFPLKVVQALRLMGHDVLTSLDAGNANRSIPDQEVLAFATGIRRTLLTLNRRDFIFLHQENPNHAGIIACTQDIDIEGQAARVHQAIVEAGDLACKLIRVNRQ
ncbi:MAG: DUF5615 family PIN-like protein [Anaerolineaceae bacterium]|nr:DUF5615 family PIN-like protein [Anaerolineaceae bacterium]